MNNIKFLTICDVINTIWMGLSLVSFLLFVCLFHHFILVLDWNVFTHVSVRVFVCVCVQQLWFGYGDCKARLRLCVCAVVLAIRCSCCVSVCLCDNEATGGWEQWHTILERRNIQKQRVSWIILFASSFTALKSPDASLKISSCFSSL